MNDKLLNKFFYLIIIISPLVFFTDLTRNPYYFQIVFAQSSMVFLWLLILLRKKGEIIHKTNPFEIPFISFYLFAILSWIISMFFLKHNYNVPQLIEDGIKVYKKNYLFMSMFNEGFKKFLFTITNVILVYLFATNYVERDNFDKIYYTFFVVGFVASIYGILQYFGIELIWPKVLNPFGGRCVSTFGNPNFLSSFLILLFPLMFAKFIYRENTFIMFIFMTVYFCALLSTLTRSSWLGLVVSLTFFLFYLVLKNKEIFLKNKKRIAFLFIFLFIILILWPKSPIGVNQSPLNRLAEIKQAKQIYTPLHQRFLIWFCGLDMVKDSFFIGKGWGLFELFYPFYQNKYLFIEKLSHRTHANNAHNEIIEVWSQTGTIGVGIYFLFLITFFIYSLKLIKYTDKINEQLIVLGLLCSIIGMFIDNMLNVTIHFCIPAFLYFFNIGAIATFDSTRKHIKFKFPIILQIAFYVVSIFIILRLILNFLGEINYFKGFKYSKRNELERALYFLSKANKFQKYEVNNNYELANTYARLKMNEEAIYYYYEALASNCGYDEIHFNLATVYAFKNPYVAKLHYTQSLFINPLSKDAYLALGSLFFNDIENNLEAAVKLYEQALKVFPNEKDFYNNLGYLYMKINQEQKALECYEKAIKIDFNFELAKKNYLMLTERLGIRDNLITKYENMMKLVDLALKNKDLTQAENLLKEILKNYHTDILAKFHLANLYFIQNRLNEAKELYNEILLVQPNNINARYNLAICLVKLSKYNEAEEQFKYILSLDPKNDIVKKHLEQLKNLKNFNF